MTRMVTGEQTALRRALTATTLSLGAVLLTASCGEMPDTRIEADKPATVLDKSKDSHWVAGTGWDHWEYTFQFLLQQCNRSEDQVSDNDGCITLLVDVDASTYGDFDKGDSLVFKHDVGGTEVFTS